MTCADDDIVDGSAPQDGNQSEDRVRLNLPGGIVVLGSKRALATQCAFFQPFVDDVDGATWGERELGHLAAALTLGAQAALPRLLEVLGSSQVNSAAWDKVFEACGVIEAFAAAHLLGAADCLEAARDWAADESFRLPAAVAKLNAKRDGAALRTAVNYGLDLRTTTKLLHAAAIADAAEATQVIVSDEDALGDVAAQAAIFTAPIDLRDGAGRTALHICAVHDSAAAAAVLLEASASLTAVCDPPEEEDDAGEADEAMPPAEAKAKPGIRTALHLAAVHDSAEVAQLLLERRANVAACVKGVDSAVTPLHECAASDSARVAKVLAAAAAAAAASEEEIEELFRRSIEDRRDQAAEVEPQDELQWSRFLDPLQAKIGMQGSTPLHVAAENDSAGVVAALLEAKADPSLGDDQGDTPLHCSVMYGCPRALMELVARGAGLLCENSSGELPIHQMSSFGEGDSELKPALEKRHFSRSVRTQSELVEALRRTGQLEAALKHAAAGDFNNTPLHCVAHWNHYGAEHAAGLLIEARADMECLNAEERTALEIATRRYGDDGRVAKLLIERGARPARPKTQELPAEAVAAVGTAPATQTVPAARELSTEAPAATTGAARVELPLLGTQLTQEHETEEAREASMAVDHELQTMQTREETEEDREASLAIEHELQIAISKDASMALP